MSIDIASCDSIIFILYQKHAAPNIDCAVKIDLQIMFYWIFLQTSIFIHSNCNDQNEKRPKLNAYIGQE